MSDNNAAYSHMMKWKVSEKMAVYRMCVFHVYSVCVGSVVLLSEL